MRIGSPLALEAGVAAPAVVGLVIGLAALPSEVPPDAAGGGEGLPLSAGVGVESSPPHAVSSADRPNAPPVRRRKSLRRINRSMRGSLLAPGSRRELTDP